MKTIINTTAVLAAAISAVSCNYLDFDETNGLRTYSDVYSYFDETKQVLTNVYSYIPQDFGAIGGAMRDCGCDDAEYGNTGGQVQWFNNGSWSALNTVDNAWSLYNGIRAANEFLESFASTDFSRFENDAQYENWEKQLKYFPYEARVLRAFFFFELAKRYGDIAMPLKKLTIGEANTIGKTSFDDVVEYIVSECDDCASNLPDTYQGQPNNETGRITRGFAMALKSKALLYAASELHNPSMDTEKWKRSAKAALDLINTGLYRLDPADKCNNVSSPETVLLRMNDASSSFHSNNPGWLNFNCVNSRHKCRCFKRGRQTCKQQNQLLNHNNNVHRIFYDSSLHWGRREHWSLLLWKCNQRRTTCERSLDCSSNGSNKHNLFNVKCAWNGS